MRGCLFKKGLVVGIIVLLVGVSISSSTGKVDIAICRTTIFDGSLSGYVNDTSGNSIEGALVRVYFHETYEEDYSDSTGYYNITNIPICKCLKYTTCSKENYRTKRVLLGIAENTSRDFILISNVVRFEFAEDNNEVELLDEYEEIISFIDGEGYCDYGHFGRDSYIYNGEISIIAITKNPKNRFYTATATDIFIPLFLGLFAGHWINSSQTYLVFTGFVFGNIEWE